MIAGKRIFNSIFASSWNDGEGAFRYGGRWNSRGRRVLYVSDSLALATLEILVNLGVEDILDDETIMTDYSFAEVGFSKDMILSVDDIALLPENWRVYPSLDEVRKIGDDWIASNTSAVLQVPTAILPIEFNYVINLDHKDIQKIKFGKPERFVFDERLR